MKDIIKGFVPQSVREGVVGDLYRMLRGREKSSKTRNSSSYESPSTVNTVEKEEVSEEMEEFEVDVLPLKSPMTASIQTVMGWRV